MKYCTTSSLHMAQRRMFTLSIISTVSVAPTENDNLWVHDRYQCHPQKLSRHEPMGILGAVQSCSNVWRIQPGFHSASWSDMHTRCVIFAHKAPTYKTLTHFPQELYCSFCMDISRVNVLPQVLHAGHSNLQNAPYNRKEGHPVPTPVFSNTDMPCSRMTVKPPKSSNIGVHLHQHRKRKNKA